MILCGSFLRKLYLRAVQVLRKIICLIAAIGPSLGVCMGQDFPDHILDGLNARQQGNGIEVSLVMKRGVECIGIDMYRSLEDGPAERVFFIGGVCGSPDFAQPYRFYDEGLDIAGTYTYHIQFGSIGEARVHADFVPLWDGGLTVVKQGEGHGIYSDVLSGRVHLEVYNVAGVLIYESITNISGTLPLPSASWPSGVYILVVRSEQHSFRQKWAKF